MTTPLEVSGSDAPIIDTALLEGAGRIEGRSLGQIAWIAPQARQGGDGGRRRDHRPGRHGDLRAR